jgi:integrase
MASVRKRIRNGKMEGWISDYFDQAGKRHIKTFERERDAKTWLSETLVSVKRGTHTPESASITVAEAANLWIEKCEAENLERSTLRQYGNHVRLHIVPLIGAVKLGRLTTPTVESFRDQLLKKGSRAMAKKVITSLKAILSEAQRRGLVAQNAALPTKVTAQRRGKGKLEAGRDFPSKAEANQILAKAEGRWRPLLVTAIFSGMRSSELRGLTWDDVNFERKVIHVRQRADAWNAMGAPKSDAGDREIPMAPMVANVLREWKLACPKGSANLVFPNGSGRVENHANIANRGFYALQQSVGMVDAHGKPKYGMHALRHFFASWAIERGFSPKKLQALLGHSSIQMTFDVYGGLFPSDESDQEVCGRRIGARRMLIATKSAIFATKTRIYAGLGDIFAESYSQGRGFKSLSRYHLYS